MAAQLDQTRYEARLPQSVDRQLNDPRPTLNQQSNHDIRMHHTSANPCRVTRTTMNRQGSTLLRRTTTTYRKGHVGEAAVLVLRLELTYQIGVWERITARRGQEIWKVPCLLPAEAIVRRSSSHVILPLGHVQLQEASAPALAGTFAPTSQTTWILWGATASQYGNKSTSSLELSDDAKGPWYVRQQTLNGFFRYENSPRQPARPCPARGRVSNPHSWPCSEAFVPRQRNFALPCGYTAGRGRQLGQLIVCSTL